MEYVTVAAVENALIVYRTFFMVTYGVLTSWGILAMILTVLKIYISKCDENGAVQKVLDLIKYAMLIYIMGNMTMFVSLSYNGDGDTMGMINGLIVVIPAIVSIGIIAIHKMFLKKKSLKNIELNNDMEIDDDDIGLEDSKIELDETAI